MNNMGFQYFNTYLSNDNFKDQYLKDSNRRVQSANDCGTIATVNNSSSLFVLSDYNQNSGDASCLYGVSHITDSSFNTLLNNDLSLCITQTGSENSCYEISNNTYFGLQNNYSLYKSPTLALMANPLVLPNIDTSKYNTLLNDLDINGPKNNLINTYITLNRTWLTNYYLDVSTIKIEDGSIIYNTNQKINDNYYKEMNKYADDINKVMTQLSDEFTIILEKLQSYNMSIQIYYKLLDIINSRIYTAQNFFNLLMNKNQGAIGELDINEYNKQLSIFNNIIITIIMLSCIYLYFKNSQ